MALQPTPVYLRLAAAIAAFFAAVAALMAVDNASSEAIFDFRAASTLWSVAEGPSAAAAEAAAPGACRTAAGGLLLAPPTAGCIAFGGAWPADFVWPTAALPKAACPPSAFCAVEVFPAAASPAAAVPSCPVAACAFWTAFRMARVSVKAARPADSAAGASPSAAGRLPPFPLAWLAEPSAPLAAL